MNGPQPLIPVNANGPWTCELGVVEPVGPTLLGDVDTEVEVDGAVVPSVTTVVERGAVVVVVLVVDVVALLTGTTTSCCSD